MILSNPKVLLVFGALIPQFIDPSGDFVCQLIFLGVTFMVVATLFDGLYAVAAVAPVVALQAPHPDRRGAQGASP